MSTAVAVRLRWHHPEWPVALAAAGAWVVVLGTHAGGHGHAAPTVGAWLLMVVAMMLPSVLPACRAVALTGRWRRRLRGQAVFVAAYLAAWAGPGAVAVAVTVTGGPAPQGVVAQWLVAPALLIAAAWELAPAKRRLLRACHRATAPAADDLACARAGLRHAAACAGSCWALMAVMFLAGPDLVLMVVLTAVVVAEKVLVTGPRLGPEAAALLVTAAVYTAVL